MIETRNDDGETGENAHEEAPQKVSLNLSGFQDSSTSTTTVTTTTAATMLLTEDRLLGETVRKKDLVYGV